MFSREGGKKVNSGLPNIGRTKKVEQWRGPGEDDVYVQSSPCFYVEKCLVVECTQRERARPCLDWTGLASPVDWLATRRVGVGQARYRAGVPGLG